MRRNTGLFKQYNIKKEPTKSSNSFDLLNDLDDAQDNDKNSTPNNNDKTNENKNITKNEYVPAKSNYKKNSFNEITKRKNIYIVDDEVDKKKINNVQNYKNDDTTENKSDSDEWQEVDKKQKNDNKSEKIEKKLFVDSIELQHQLPRKWKLWVHIVESNVWTPESYDNVFEINSLKTFWEIITNLEHLDLVKFQFFIMKDTSGPYWEHISNRNGGVCSMRIVKDRLLEVIEQLSILVINESFTDAPNDINGISFSLVHNWGIIKIWNTDKTNDISKDVPNYIIRKYSASVKYKANKPEY